MVAIAACGGKDAAFCRCMVTSTRFACPAKGPFARRHLGATCCVIVTYKIVLHIVMITSLLYSGWQAASSQFSPTVPGQFVASSGRKPFSQSFMYRCGASRPMSAGYWHSEARLPRASPPDKL